MKRNTDFDRLLFMLWLNQCGGSKGIMSWKSMFTSKVPHHFLSGQFVFNAEGSCQANYLDSLVVS